VEGVYLDVRYTLDNTAPWDSQMINQWKAYKLSANQSGSISPYQDLGLGELDPFNCINLSRDDQQLLHHCRRHGL
jgi:hypothetical protein